jgi:hypothetical protein
MAARVMRAYDCSVAASGAVDADFVLQYGGEEQLNQRTALARLQRDSRDGMADSVNADWWRRASEKAVHDRGQIVLHTGALALLHAVLGVNLSDVRPPKGAPRKARDATAAPWKVAASEVTRRLDDPDVCGRNLLVNMAPLLGGKPFNLKLPHTNRGWDAATAVKSLRAVLKAFGLTVETRVRGGKKNRQTTYALVLSGKVDAALSQVLACANSTVSNEQS